MNYIDFVENDKICPNPLHSHADEFPKDTLLVNLPKTLSLFESVNDFPCNFASSMDEKVKKVIVRAIHPSANAWDFSHAESCDYFIKVCPPFHHFHFHFHYTCIYMFIIIYIQTQFTIHISILFFVFNMDLNSSKGVTTIIIEMSMSPVTRRK
jgi:hypothetical protein